jgi:hypothetical protein
MEAQQGAMPGWRAPVCLAAPITMLRMVLFPRFAGEEK